jgi:hypothetical protein
MAVSFLHHMECIGHGISSMVFAIEVKTVMKIPRGNAESARDKSNLPTTRPASRIVRYIRSEPRGLVLERLVEPLRKRLRELHAQGKLPSKGLVKK